MEWEIRYYSKQIQREIRKFPPDVQAQTDRIVKLLEKFGPVEIPGKTKQWEGEVWEITANSRSGWGRVMYIAMDGDVIWLLYAILKKTNTTPEHIAREVRKRAKEVKNA